MRRSAKMEAALSLGRRRTLQALFAAALLYVVVVFLYELPFLSRWHPSAFFSSSANAVSRSLHLGAEDRLAPLRPSQRPHRLPGLASDPAGLRLPSDLPRPLVVAGLDFRPLEATAGGRGPFSGLHKAARDAWEVGRKLLEQLKAVSVAASASVEDENRTVERCPQSIVLSGEKLLELGRVMVLPCGLTLGSHITLVAKPYRAHAERDPKIRTLNEGEQATMVSQFMMELQGLKTVDGDDPPRILHLNPRLKGDWSGKPVIEQNTCYRMQWGSAQRCQGWKSTDTEETGGFLKLSPLIIDGLVKCEKWIDDGDNKEEESKTAWWLNRLIGRTKKVRTVSARYIMKCDDDTFVRVDAVMNEVEKVSSDKSLYVGNINYRHKPLREGKWAVTYEVNDCKLSSYI
ncbi:hypothetical protein BHE74_00014730 [Ensete ventricosum]|nr:hypothetical protein BHE74_00014730 [Ensete ventricosum]